MSATRLKTAARDILREADRLLARGATAAEFSGQFFGPGGKLTALAENETARRQLVESDLYRALQDRLSDLRRKEAEAFERDIDAHSGRLTVVVPKSLHAALKREAALEGISLAELIRLKLGVAYRQMVRLVVPGEVALAHGGRVGDRKR